MIRRIKFEINFKHFTAEKRQNLLHSVIGSKLIDIKRYFQTEKDKKTFTELERGKDPVMFGFKPIGLKFSNKIELNIFNVEPLRLMAFKDAHENDMRWGAEGPYTFPPKLSVLDSNSKLSPFIGKEVIMVHYLEDASDYQNYGKIRGVTFTFNDNSVLTLGYKIIDRALSLNVFPWSPDDALFRKIKIKTQLINQDLTGFVSNRSHLMPIRIIDLDLRRGKIFVAPEFLIGINNVRGKEFLNNLKQVLKTQTIGILDLKIAIHEDGNLGVLGPIDTVDEIVPSNFEFINEILSGLELEKSL
jgi:hypothetical protein